MKDFIKKFSKPGHLVLDLFLDMLSNAKAFFLVERYQCLVASEKDVKCLEKSMARPVEAYDSQLLNQESDLPDDEELTEVARLYLETAKGRRLRCALDSWKAPSGWPSIKTDQNHVMSYFCAQYNEYSVYSID